MKRVMSIIMVACMLMGLSVPAMAKENVGISSYEELIAAIDEANIGDTIEVSEQIELHSGENIVTDKRITIKRANNNYCADVFVILSGAECIIDGVDFVSNNSRGMIGVRSSGIGLTIRNCNFSLGAYPITIDNQDSDMSRVNIEGSTFSNTNEGAIYGNGNIEVTISDCIFSGNKCLYDLGSVRFLGGTLHLTRCTFRENVSLENAAIIFQDISENGTLDIVDCRFENNCATLEDPLASNDIYTFGCELNLSDGNVDESMRYYDMATGHKSTVELPLEGYRNMTKISYLPYDPDADKDETEGDGQDIDTPPESGDDNTEQPETPPQPEPPAEENPPASDDSPQGQETDKEDNQGGDNQPQEPDDNSDEESSQEPPEQPKPPQDDDTPAASEKPSHGHSRPSVSVPAPAPKLQCGEAVIDSTRSAKLSGYGDGQLHLEDSLTRAQMSKIIYGLLDENCIEKIGKSNDGFNDVPAEAWFHAAVSTLYNAGVVNGVGGGNYNPNDTVTWAQIIAVLSRFVDEEDCTLHNIAYNGWAESAIKTAVALQWIEDRSSFDANAIISRGEFVELVNHVLSLYV